MAGDVHDTVPRLVVALGGDPASLRELPGGSVNYTFRVRLRDRDAVVRVPVDPLRATDYPAEAWASDAAGRAGIPVADTIHVGEHDGTPFLVTAFVPSSAEPVENPWSWLGSYALAIGSLPLDEAPSSLFTRFGRDPAAAWAAHLAYNLTALHDDPLLQDGAFTDTEPLLDRFEALAAERFAFGAAHGDLAPRNLLVQGVGAAPVLIDWGSVGTGPAPWTDAIPVFLSAFVDEEITEAAFDEFATAAGLTRPGDRTILEAMTALHLVDTTRWARDRRPDLSPTYVDRCRRGLQRLGLSG